MSYTKYPQCHWYVFFIVWLASHFLSLAAPYSWASSTPARILVLHSYHQGHYWTDGLQQAIVQKFIQSSQEVDLDIHYLDMARLENNEKKLHSISLMMRHLVEKPQIHQEYALVLTTDNEALDMALTYREQIAPNTPIIFCAVNNFNHNLLLGQADVTGVVENPSFAETITLAKKLRPQLQKVLVLVENTFTGKQNQHTMYQQRGDLPQGILVENLLTTDIHEIEQRLRILTPEWVVLNLCRPFENQRLLPLAEAAKRICQAAPVPVLTGWDLDMGYGYLGGVVVSSKAQGEAAVDMALKILRGENINAIPIQIHSPNVAMVDELAAKRFHISTSIFPPGTVILNHTPNFYAQHSDLVWISGFIALSFIALAMALGTNIFYRHKAETALRRQIAFTQTLLQTIPTPVYYKDIQGRFWGCNQAFSQFYGFKHEDILGKTSADLFPPDQVKIFQEQDQLLWSTGEPQRHDQTTITPQGERQVVTQQAFFYDHGQRAGIVGVVTDVSELALAEERLQLAFTASRAGIWEWDHITGNVYYSPRWKEIIGFQEHELESDIREWRKRIHPQDRDRVLLVYDQFYQSSAPSFALEYRLRHKDGSYRWIEVFATCLRDAQGRSYRVTGSHSDITSRKNLELKLRAARDAAIAANKAKSTFLANMSHEIRTPLNGILGMLQLLQPMITDNKQREYVDLAIISSQRLTSLLSDILDFSRIESGQLAIEVHPFAVTDLQDALLGLFHITAQKKNLTLTVDIDPQLPAIVGGDKFRVQQILFNLVGNALKFTSFGSVQVSINTLPLGKTLDHFQIYFEVKDTGSGISEKHLEKIFEPFMQAEGSYERKHQGVGLGLSIVHRLISLMRGTLCIDTAPKEGTTIGMSLSMTYPVLDTRPTPVPHRSKKHTQIPHLEILLVEDDEVNLFAARHLLQRLGHQVIVARNGQEAVNLAMSKDFDVIFMDIQMPVMDGLEATKAIRAFPGPRAQVPIIAMTAYAMNGDQELFLTSGMDSYIPKPVDKHTLEQTLEHTFSGSKHKN